MLSVEEAVQKILDSVRVLESETKPILECLGQVLAEDVYSDVTIPPSASSTMDGYAVRWESIRGANRASPVTLWEIGQAAAGHVFNGEVTPGTAVRIMTGAPVPSGADTVVPFESTNEEDRKHMARCSDEIKVMREIERGLHIRPMGEDVKKGDRVLARGTVLRPQEIGVLASIGRTEATVTRRPIVAILATGDELAELGQTLDPGKMYASNSYTLAAQVLRYGGIPRLLGIGADSRSDLSERMALAMEADMLLTSGGASMGDRDLIKEALAEHGSISFERVRMRPGKALVFGILERGERHVPHLGLPGNPVGCMIAFEESARPAILKMLGKRNLEKLMVTAVSENGISNPEGVRLYTKAIVRREGDQYFVRMAGPQGSGILTSMVRANGLVVLPEETREIREGDRVQVQMLDWLMEG